MNIRTEYYERRLKLIEIWPNGPYRAPDLRIVVWRKKILGEVKDWNMTHTMVISLRIVMAWKNAKKCMVRKSAYLTGKSSIDLCDIQKSLIDRRHGKPVGRKGDF